MGAARDGRAQIILCADDYAMSEGITQAIGELAQAGRLSATSAIATLARWPEDARWLRALRGNIAVGLHINLTLGTPLGPTPSIARNGCLPSLGRLATLAVSGRVNAKEVEAEVARQLARFEAEVGFAPDHVDGHQHVHVLPRVRDGVLAALSARYRDRRPLLRDPGDRISRILARTSATGKALIIALLSSGFGRAARAHGFATNTSFAGVSSFDRRTPYERELEAALSFATRRHLIMCHPGRSGGASESSEDPIAARREDEYKAIMHHTGLPDLLWHPSRTKDGPSVSWEQI